MRLFLLSLSLLLLTGCMSYSRTEIGFWDQHVMATGWGIGWITPYGPLYVGYFNWERNIAQPIPPTPPGLPAATLP